MNKALRKVGILGGTFDPPHNGHLKLAEIAIDELKLNNFIFMPAFVQPFKRYNLVSSADDRLKMLKLFLQNFKYRDISEISTYEIDKAQVSYTYETIRNYINDNQKDELWFIMGTDSLLKMDRWYKGDELLKLCKFAVGLREGEKREEIKAVISEYNSQYGSVIKILSGEMLKISSTNIRREVLKGISISGKLPNPVEDYIVNNNLYKDESLLNLLTEKRRIHTEGVIDEAIKLGKFYGENLSKIKIAAICHDLFRGRDIEEINELVDRYGLNDKYINNANLAHGKIASEFMKEELNIQDEDLINAVSYHTTGRPGMSLLEKIIFIADAIEPGRNYPQVELIREKAYINIDEACLLSLEGTVSHLNENGLSLNEIDNDTLKAIEFYKEKLNK